MSLHSKWITTTDFYPLKPLNVFHKEYDAIDVPPSVLRNQHVAFRAYFEVLDSRAYRIDLTADDYYKLYINGCLVGQGPKPAYPAYQPFNRFNISSFLHPGNNSIAVHVYYNGEINRSYQSGDQRFGLLLDIYEDEQHIGGSDGSWRYGKLNEYTGAVTVGYETAYLEDIDFRLESKNWRETDYDDSAWPLAIVNDHDDHVLETQPTPAVSIYDQFPESCRKIAPGHYLIDFGEELSGQFYLKMKGDRHQTIRILCAEELAEDSSNEANQTQLDHQVRYEMRCNCRYEEIITLSGEMDELLFFDYMAFRYVEVISESDNLTPESFKAIRRHHPLELIQELHTSNADLARIWTISVNTLRCAAQEILVDCPTREKGQYLGDFTVSGLSHLYLTGDIDYYLAILRDFARSASICPGLMAVVPGSFMQEIADFSLLFPLQVMNAYRYRKDQNILYEFLPVMEGILDHFAPYARTDGLLEGVSDKWNLVDWPPNLRDDYDFELPARARTDGCHNVINAYYIGAIKILNSIYQELNLPVQDQNEARLIQAFINEFYDQEARLFKDTAHSAKHSLHSNTLPAFYGFLPDEAHDSIHAHIMKKGLSCGVFFSYFVLKALCLLGQTEDAYHLMLNDSEQGWINMLREGASTCFEAWGKDQKWNTSLCHPWATVPIILLNEDFNGRFGVEIRVL